MGNMLGNMLALVQYPIFGRPLKGSKMVGKRGVREIIWSFSLVDTVGSLFPDAACIYIYIVQADCNSGPYWH